MMELKHSERIFECVNCGATCQGYNAAHWWWDCQCGDKELRELTEEEYAEVYPWKVKED
jgi:hypothetical protein